MSIELGRGDWSGGYTALSVDEDGYEFKSDYDDDEEPTPPTVTLTPSELRNLIRQAQASVYGAPFVDGDFGPLAQWYKANGDKVIASVGDRDNICKEFRMKENDETGVPYLKVQRWKNGSPLRDSPTLGPDEFEGIFESVVVL